MKLLFLLLLQFSVVSVFGQKIDSISYSNGNLYFHEYGVGDPVIILSGGPGANYQQMEEVAMNVGKTHNAILLEQRGTGRSMPRPYDSTTINLKEAHADLIRLLDHIKVKEAQFLGHSWGAMLAMSFASEYPDRVTSLILVNPGPFKLDLLTNEIYRHNKEVRLSTIEKQSRNSDLQQAQKERLAEEGKALVEKWELLPVLYDRSKVDSMAPIINKGGLNPRMGGLMFQDLGKKGFDLSKKLSQLNKPIHIISGSQDPGAFISYEIKLLLPKSQLHWINKSGHFPMYEQPEEFYTTVSEILSIK